MPATHRILTIFLTMITLSSCGFALRGSSTTLDDSISVFLETSHPNEVLVERITSSLQSAGVEVSSDTNSDYTLHMAEEQFVSRPATVNGRARAVQYDLQLAVEYSLARQDTLLIPTETMTTNRIHFEDIANISGSSEELTLLREEMRQELVDRLLRRISASANSAAP